MQTGALILIYAGLGLLFIGALSGIPMGLTRMADGNPPVPKYLTMLHLAGYQQAPILLGLGAAFEIVEPTNWASAIGPAVFAVSAALLATKEFVNWRQGVDDEFAQSSLGLMIGNIFGPVHIVGLVLCTIALVPAMG